MFALANVETFLEENADIVGKKTTSILKRAHKLATNGLLTDDSLKKVFGSRSLAGKFHKVATNSVTHIVQRITAMHKAVYSARATT